MPDLNADPKPSVSSLLPPPVPALPGEELINFVTPFFDRGRDYLQMAQTHGSPLYLLDRPALIAGAGRLKAAFEKAISPVGFYFAVKSNNHPEIARTLLEERFGLDVSSGLELEMALGLGARDIVFSGPGKRDEELALAVGHADSVVLLMDSWGELQRVEKVAAAARRTVRCGVRLTSGTDGLWRKFGIPMEELADFWHAANQSEHIHLCGLQFHISWNLSPRPQVAFIEKLGRVLATLPAGFQHSLEFIDIGGGYWPEQGEWLHPGATPAGRAREALEETPLPRLPHHRLPALPIETFADQLGAAIEEHLFPVRPCRICIEPGRWISHPAMHLLISVVDKKAPDLVITDAGTNTIGWERFESDYFPVLNLSRPSLTERPCHILGSLCTPHDVWGYFYFGEAIQPGDVLMIPTQGAYTYSLRQNFIKPLPEVAVMEGRGR
jgi:diaminopimelate decarboxylase